MPITVEWFDKERNTIYVDYVGRWTWRDWESIHPGIYQMMAETDQKVDFIVNLTRSAFPPPGALYRLKDYVANSPGNHGVVVFVGMKSFMKAIVKTFWYFFPEMASKYPFEFAATVAEAEASLMRHRAEWA